MAKFHINEAGNPGICSAQEGGCPFGGELEHYSTAEDARHAYEKVMSLGGEWNGAKKNDLLDRDELLDGYVEVNRTTRGFDEYYQNRLNENPSPRKTTVEGGRTAATQQLALADVELTKESERMRLPIFDEFDGQVSHEARERVNVLAARVDTLKAIKAIFDLGHFEPLWLKAQKIADLVESQPESRPTADSFQRWQERVNIVGNFLNEHFSDWEATDHFNSLKLVEPVDYYYEANRP